MCFFRGDRKKMHRNDVYLAIETECFSRTIYPFTPHSIFRRENLTENVEQHSHVYVYMYIYKNMGSRLRNERVRNHCASSGSLTALGCYATREPAPMVSRVSWPLSWPHFRFATLSTLIFRRFARSTILDQKTKIL